MSPPRQEVPSGCVWVLIVVIAIFIGYTIVSDLARMWVWIKWAFE